jgi:hypothetical protein
MSSYVATTEETDSWGNVRVEEPRSSEDIFEDIFLNHPATQLTRHQKTAYNAREKSNEDMMNILNTLTPVIGRIITTKLVSWGVRRCGEKDAERYLLRRVLHASCVRTYTGMLVTSYAFDFPKHDEWETAVHFEPEEYV